MFEQNNVLLNNNSLQYICDLLLGLFEHLVRYLKFKGYVNALSCININFSFDGYKTVMMYFGVIIHKLFKTSGTNLISQSYMTHNM